MMGSADSHKLFVWVLAAAFLLVCLFGAGFNYLVDPYGLFGTPRISGFNELKPAASERARVIKPYMASRAKPKVVIGGNSRPEIGLNPQSACWGKADQPVFNMGIPGADVFMQTRYVQHAVENGEAQRVLLGVDFLDFLVDSSKPTGEIDWNFLGKSFNGRLNPGSKEGLGTNISFQNAEDIFSGLFSLVALGDSVMTIASQRDKDAATRREDGFNPGLDYRPIIRNEGQSVLFRQKNLEVRKSLQQNDIDVLDIHGQRTMPLEALRRFLEWAKTRGVDVVLFINPYHSDYLIQIEMAGKWPEFEEWKRQLTLVAEEYAVPLWDFNTFDRYSTESPPSPGDKRSELHWFWEPAHYRYELGDLMLASMLNRQCGSSPMPSKFGVKITQSSLQHHLDGLRSEMGQFIDENPQVVKRLSNEEL
jgi:hypothetical protein